MKTYGNLEVSKDEVTGKSFFTFTNLEPHVIMKLKQFFTKISPTKVKSFSLPVTGVIAADVTMFRARYPLVMTKSDAKLLKKATKQHYQKVDLIESIKTPNYETKKRVGLKPGVKLRGYQSVAVDIAEEVKVMLLIDEMGLGKTLEGLAMALIDGNLPMVCVVEAPLQSQWGQMADKFVDLKVHEVKSSKPYTLPEADLYIFKYSQLAPWIDILTAGWVKSIVFDEVQNLRTGTDSAKGKAAQAICEVVDFRVGMTGTLVYNYGIECWNVANIINPGLLGSRYEFLREWCTGESGDKGIVKDPDALGSYLREEQFVLRRTRADIGQEVKQKSPEMIKVKADEKSVKGLEDLLDDLAVSVLTSSDGQEVRNSSSQFDLRLRQLTGIAKAKETAAFVRMLVEQGSSVVLFGYHREVYRIWEKELGDLEPAWFTGSESPSKKEKEKARFINKETKLLIMSLSTGAGVDGFQHVCSNVVFGELAWSKNRHKQCIARVDRDDQAEDVYVYYMISEFGSDPVMMDIIGVKGEQSRGIQDPGVAPVVLEQDKDRIKNMARNYLRSRGVAYEERESLTAKELASSI